MNDSNMEWIRHLNDCAVRSLQQSNSIECKTLLADALERLNASPGQEEGSLEDLPSQVNAPVDANTIQECASAASVIMTTQHQSSTIGLSHVNISTDSTLTFRSVPGTYHESDEIYQPTLFGEQDKDESSLSAQLAHSSKPSCLETEAFPLYSRPFVFDSPRAPLERYHHSRSCVTKSSSQEAAVVAPPPKGTTSLPSSQRKLCSALCLYNLALAHCLEYRSYRAGQKHNHSTSNPVRESLHQQQQQPGDHLLERALALYEVAYYILVHLSTVQSGDSPMILIMAVCNNIASVHQSLGNLDASAEWKELLSYALSCCQFVNLDDQDSLEFFYFIAHIFPNFNAGAAA